MSELRKQYHFRPSPHGYCAWDVSTLVGKSRDMPVVNFPIEKIAEVDELWWFQDSSDVPTPRSILEHFGKMIRVELDCPIILDPDCRLMDGMHRVLKAIYQNQKYIPARILNEMPEPDFVDVLPDKLPY